ncbi:hypothetical protein FJZ19_00975 [Candidatus Pacearchaeota archaeon]|nr:hypothetical protein [Candidatus Pacearchaeota archaeon]
MEQEYHTPNDVVGVGHWIENYLGLASLMLEEGRADEAKQQKERMLQGLRGLDKTTLVERCIILAEQSEVSTMGVNKLRKDYQALPEIRLNDAEIEKVLKRIRGEL